MKVDAHLRRQLIRVDRLVELHQDGPPVSHGPEAPLHGGVDLLVLFFFPEEGAEDLPIPLPFSHFAHRKAL
ncbi:hypothetical protein MASR1M66_12980 [Aminivibrio sp.]